MKKIMVAILTLASISAFAEELVPLKSCEGFDPNRGEVSVTISARMNQGKPVMSYAGPLYQVVVSLNDEVVFASQVAKFNDEGYERKFSDGSSMFIVQFSKFENSDKEDIHARLYLSLFPAQGPTYNTLPLICRDL